MPVPNKDKLGTYSSSKRVRPYYTHPPNYTGQTRE